MSKAEKLRNAIRRSGKTNDEFARAIGIDDSTLYRKLNEDCKGFTVEELDSIIRVLSLEKQEVLDLFFA